jgi:predicted metal-binding membrane protein
VLLEKIAGIGVGKVAGALLAAWGVWTMVKG